MEIYLLTVSERHILSLTKAHTRLPPWVWWQWCRKSELRRTPLFSKHSDRGEKLIIQSPEPRRPHLIVSQKKGQSSSCEEPPGPAPRRPKGRVALRGGAAIGLAAPFTRARMSGRGRARETRARRLQQGLSASDHLEELLVFLPRRGTEGLNKGRTVKRLKAEQLFGHSVAQNMVKFWRRCPFR